MINLFHKHEGAATLLITAILMVSVSMIVIFAANYSMMQQKISANGNRNQQAYEAAEAGLEYGINYLQQNGATIMASKVSGFIQPYSDSNTNNVTLGNGSKYTIVYSNPVANDYTLITITSTGTSDDGTATRVVAQQVKYGSTLFSTPQNTLSAKGAVSMGGSSRIINTTNNQTIQSGGSVSFSGSSQTTISSGVGSSSSGLGSDVQANNSTLSGQSSNDFFCRVFWRQYEYGKKHSQLYVFKSGELQ